MKKPYGKIMAGLAIGAIISLLAASYGGAADRELKRFNVGYLASTGHAMYFIAKEKGYFEQEGLDVQLFLFTNSGEGMNAITSGKLDAGTFGTAPPLLFISKGVDITIFGGQMSEGHGLVAKPEKAEQFKDLKNYKGKTIATVRLQTGDVVFRGGLHHAGIDWKKDVTIKELDSPGAVLEAVKKGSVDAGILWPPFLTLAEEQGLKVALRSGDVLPNHTCCRQVALTTKLKADEADYVKFERALIRAHAFYKAYPDETVEITSKYVKIDKGILKTFLMSRSPIRGIASSNGHGRRAPGYEVVSRQSNLFVEAAQTVSEARLRELLIAEIKRQNKPYGLYFQQVTGGYTTTGRQGLQAFSVIPVVLYRVYPDGRPDELVRGADVVGTPLASFAKILAASDRPEIFNGYCGAESGNVPVSAVSPAILVSEIEIQKKEKSQDRPPYLSAPAMGGPQ